MKLAEKRSTVEPLSDLLVFHQRALPAEAVTAAQLTDGWIAAARRQLSETPSTANAAALRHALGLLPSGAAAPAALKRTVLVAHSDPAVGKALASAGFSVRPMTFTPFDEAAAAKVRHFETYNQTAAGRRVEEVVGAVNANPGAAIVADGDAALAALLAAAVVSVPVAVLDVGRFDTSSDESYLEPALHPGPAPRRRSPDGGLARPREARPPQCRRSLRRQRPRQAAAQLTPAEIAAVLRR